MSTLLKRFIECTAKASFNTSFLMIFCVGNVIVGFLEMAVRDAIRKSSYEIEIIYFMCALTLFYILFSVRQVFVVREKQNTVRPNAVTCFLMIYMVACVLTFLLTSAFSPLTYLGSNLFNWLIYDRTGFHTIPVAIDYYTSKL